MCLRILFVSQLREWPLFVTMTTPMLSEWMRKIRPPTGLGDRKCRLIATWSPSSIAIASAQLMLYIIRGPTVKLGAHFQMAHCEPKTIPTLKDVLASPHQPRSIRSGGARGILSGRFSTRKWTQDRLAERGGGT